jgi:hypothetical protein
VEWLKVKALSSSPSTTKKKKKRGKTQQIACFKKLIIPTKTCTDCKEEDGK